MGVNSSTFPNKSTEEVINKIGTQKTLTGMMVGTKKKFHHCRHRSVGDCRCNPIYMDASETAKCGLADCRSGGGKH